MDPTPPDPDSPSTPPPLPSSGAVPNPLTGKRSVNSSMTLRPTGGQRMVPSLPKAPGDGSVRVQSAPVAATLPAGVVRAQADRAPSPAAKSGERSSPRKPAPTADPSSSGLQGAKAFVAWLFAFGPFAKGMTQRDRMPPCFPLALAVAGIGLLWPMLLWLVPTDPGPVPMLDTGFWVSTFVKAMLLGPGVYFVLGLLVHLLLKMAGGRQDFSLAAQTAFYAWLPFSVLQIAAVAYAGYTWGEAYWRGYLPAWVAENSGFVTAGLLALAGLRIAAAAHAQLGLSRLRVALVLLLIPLGVLAYPTLDSFYQSYNQKRTSAAWLERAENGYLARDAKPARIHYDKALADLGARDFDLRARMFLHRGELYLLDGKTTEARADFLRVAHMFPPTEALHHVANAANFLALGHGDFAMARLNTALDLSPDDPRVHHWLTRHALGEFIPAAADPSLAERHGRVLYRLEPSVLSARYWIMALYRQKNYAETLETALAVSSKPGVHALSLYQGGMAAHHMGNSPSAARLFELAVKKDGQYAADSVVKRYDKGWAVKTR